MESGLSERWNAIGRLGTAAAFYATGVGKTWFDAADYVASNLLLPLGAVLTSVLVGWRLERATVAEELAETTPLG